MGTRLDLTGSLTGEIDAPSACRCVGASAAWATHHGRELRVARFVFFLRHDRELCVARFVLLLMHDREGSTFEVYGSKVFGPVY